MKIVVLQDPLTKRVRSLQLVGEAFLDEHFLTQSVKVMVRHSNAFSIAVVPTEGGEGCVMDVTDELDDEGDV